MITATDLSASLLLLLIYLFYLFRSRLSRIRWRLFFLIYPAILLPLQLYRYSFSDLFGFSQVLDLVNPVSAIAYIFYRFLGGFLTLYLLSSIALVELKVTLITKLSLISLPTLSRRILYYLLFVSPSFVLFQYFLGKDSYMAIFLLLAIASYLDFVLSRSSSSLYLFHIYNCIAFIPRSYFILLYPLALLPGFLSSVSKLRLSKRLLRMFLLFFAGLVIFVIAFQEAISYRFGFLWTYLTRFLASDLLSVSDSVGLSESAIQYEIYSFPSSLLNIFRPFPGELGSEAIFQLLMIFEHYGALFLLFVLVALRLPPYLLSTCVSALFFVICFLLFPSLNPNIIDMYRRLPTYFLFSLSLFAPLFFKPRKY